jgi:hypothetical protein
MAKAKKNKISKWFTKHIIKIAFIAWLSVILAYVFNFRIYSISSESAGWGQFGDYIGGTLNPLLSFFALVILYKTFSMQRKELALQREELKDTKTILKEQSETQKKQQFENTFFELLKIHNQSLESLVEIIHIPAQSGTHLLVSAYSYSNLGNIVLSIFGNEKIVPIEDNIIRLNESKQKLMANHPLSGHYFRILYQVLKFIAVNSENSITEAFSAEDIQRDDISSREKIYSNIVRALLPNDLMRLVAVNCYCENGESDIYWRYKLLIERYEFFEHLSFDCSDERYKEIWQDITKHYRKKAFGK